MPQKILVNNLEIFYSTSGSPQSPNKVLILHGWNQHGSQSWLEFLAKGARRGSTDRTKNTSSNSLESDLFLVAVDLPCFGNSGCPETVWDTFDYADFCIQLLQALKLKYPAEVETWNLLGHSFGGAIASLVASKIPTQINTLTLVAPAIIRKKLTKKQLLIQKITRILNSLSQLPFLSQAKPFLTKIWYRLIGSPDYNLTTGIKRQIMTTILKQDLLDILPSISTKTLLIWGTKDTYTPFEDFEVVSRQVKLVKSLIYDGFGHGIHIQNCSKLYQDIADFVLNQNTNH